jgi:hypothetical protein
MKASPSESSTNTASTIERSVGLPKVTPNYATFGADQIRVASEALWVPTLAYLRGLDFRSLALVLSLLAMGGTALALAWPVGDPNGYRVLGACAVCLMVAATGLVAFLTETGNCRATLTEDRPHVPPHAGLGGAGTEGT